MQETFIFLFFVTTFLLLPSFAVLSRFRIGSFPDILLFFGVHLGFGLVLFTIAVLVIRFFGGPFWLLWILPWASALFLVRSRSFSVFRKLRDGKIREAFRPVLLALLVIAVGIGAQMLALYRGGTVVAEGTVFPAVHDTMWNIAITQELTHRFPPMHPGMSGERLANNHYFYPLFLAAANRLTGISVIELYYRFGPFLVSLLFGCSLYAASSIFIKGRTLRAVSVFLGYFSGNASYVLPFFKGMSFDWRGNTFYADQPFDQIVNPYSVVGFSLFLLCGYFLFRTVSSRGIGKAWAGALLSTVAVTYGFKSFAGLIVLAGIAGSLALLFVFTRKKAYAALFLASLVSFVPVFFLITEPGKAGLLWIPGWLLDQMMVGENRVNMPGLIAAKNYYRSIGNSLGIVKITAIEFGIYVLGNFGIRILGIIPFILFFRILNKNSTQISPMVYFILSGLCAFSLPLLFNLQNSAFNIVQFTPFALLAAALGTGVFLEMVWEWTSRKRAYVAYMTVVAVVLLAIPVNVKNIRDKMKEKFEIIPSSQMEGLAVIRANSSPNETILINPADFAIHPMHVPGLTGRQVYLADDSYAIQTGRDPATRLTAVRSFFAGGEDTAAFARSRDITYVYLLQSSRYTQLRSTMEKEGWKMIFAKDDVTAYSL